MNKKLWEQFKNGEKIAINCKTEKESDKFMELCEKNHIKWWNGENATRWRIWSRHKESTCYTNGFDGDNGIGFGAVDFHQEKGYQIVTYTELMKETFTGSELAQLLRDKKFKEGTKFCDEYGTIYSVVSLLTGFDIRHNGSSVNSYIIINGTFTLIEEPKLYFLNQAIKSNKQIKLKDWENYHDIEQALIHLSRLSKETIQEALTMQVWEVEE